MGDDPRQKQLAQRLTAALSNAASMAAAAPTAIATATGPTRAPTTKAISFAPELIAAILAGRKTETRRLVRPQPAESQKPPSIAKCVIARPGDLLYVREPWAEHDGRIAYAADGEFGVPRYRPAMFMPRHASRLTLRVTGVHAERLTLLTPQAARAEGAPASAVDPASWFANLWDRLFTSPGERFADDPWVWVIAFSRVSGSLSK